MRKPAVAQKSMSPLAWVQLICLSMIWGASFLSTAVILREVGVVTIVAWRVGLAVLVMWAWVLMRGYRVPRSPAIWAAMLGMGLLNNVIPFSLITWSQQHIPSGLASILNATTAIFGIVIASICFADERLTARRAVGVLLGFFGVALVIGLSALQGFSPTSAGQLAMLGAALSYGLSSAFARRFISGIQPEVAAAGMLTGSTLIIVPAAIALEGVPSFNHSPAVWMGILYISLLSTGVAYLLYYRVLASAGSGNLSMTTLLVAPIAILLGALVLGESLSAQSYAGFACIALGLMIIDGRILRRRARTATPLTRAE